MMCGIFDLSLFCPTNLYPSIPSGFAKKQTGHLNQHYITNYHLDPFGDYSRLLLSYIFPQFISNSQVFDVFHVFSPHFNSNFGQMTGLHQVDAGGRSASWVKWERICFLMPFVRNKALLRNYKEIMMTMLNPGFLLLYTWLLDDL